MVIILSASFLLNQVSDGVRRLGMVIPAIMITDTSVYFLNVAIPLTHRNRETDNDQIEYRSLRGFQTQIEFKFGMSKI